MISFTALGASGLSFTLVGISINIGGKPSENNEESYSGDKIDLFNADMGVETYEENGSTVMYRV